MYNIWEYIDEFANLEMSIKNKKILDKPLLLVSNPKFNEILGMKQPSGDLDISEYPGNRFDGLQLEDFEEISKKIKYFDRELLCNLISEWK